MDWWVHPRFDDGFVHHYGRVGFFRAADAAQQVLAATSADATTGFTVQEQLPALCMPAAIWLLDVLAYAQRSCFHLTL
jgi:hypothetical protein